MPKLYSKNRGFTLIELLVAVAIVCILIGMLMPVLRWLYTLLLTLLARIFQ